VRTLTLGALDWSGHRASQHLDVRLTAEDGGPLMLIAGGSGVVPLRAMLRYLQLSASTVPARLLYSARTLPDVIYAAELARFQANDGVEVIVTLTREQPPGWTGRTGRVDAALLSDVAWHASEAPLAYGCGPTSFVEAVAATLVGLGYPPQRVKTERFGGTGGP
jgi:ferredoxin-NADP reductase